MYLHNFTSPRVYEYDTLTSEDRWGEYFDIILANPPFMSPKGGIKPHKKFSLQANRSEVLFVDYIAEHINPRTGRAGIIVPEGIIFQSGKAYKQLRQMLVDKRYLYAVVSLPAGIFQPYSGVKTSILLMDRTLAKKTDNILFVKIENDGFDLGAQRRAIEKNDLTAALIHLQEYKDALINNTAFVSENKNVFVVDKKKIAGSGDYNLSEDRYRESEVKQKSNYELVRLGDLCEILSGYPFDANKFNEDIGFPVVRIRDIKPNSTKTKYDGDVIESHLINNDDLIIGMDGEFNRALWKGGKALLNQRVCKLYNFKNVLKEYVYRLIDIQLKKIEAETQAVTVKHISNKQILNIEIPLPPVSIQQEIVAKIETFQRIIDGAKQVVENYKPEIDIAPDWEIMELGEIAAFKNGINYTQESKGEVVRILGVRDFKKNLTAPINNFDSVQIDNKLSDEFLLKENDIVFVRSNGNPDLIGRCVIIPKLNFPATFSGFTIRLRFTSDEVVPMFYAYLFKSDYLRNKIIEAGTGANIKSINQPSLKALKVPLPSIETQSSTIMKIQKVEILVNANKELIKIYEQKIKDEINKLWQPGKKEVVYDENEELSMVAEG